MKRMLSLFVICAAILSAVTPALAARIDSAEIMPADGVTGQDIQSGDGVKTGHIQDFAVTDAKIADGAVTDAKISGVISGAKLGSHGHYGSDILDGTITESKIAGQISASKISSVGLDADTLDGFQASEFSAFAHTHEELQSNYKNVIVVAKGGGDYSDPVAALNSITDS